MNHVDFLYSAVYNAVHSTGNPWETYCERWGPVEETKSLIKGLPDPNRATELEKRCVLEEVRRGYLEFLYHFPLVIENRNGILGRALPVFSPSLEDFIELQEKSLFFKSTVQYKSRL